MSELITKVEKQGCGCEVETYADDKQQVKPCEQHANAMQSMEALMAAQFTLKVYQRIIGHLLVVGDGCKKHPAYRAVKKPIADCKLCQAIWGSQRSLPKLFKKIGLGLREEEKHEEQSAGNP